MLRLFILFLFTASIVVGQTVESCRQRFHRYFDHKGRLSPFVKFEAEGIFIYSGGVKKIALYESELAAVSHFFEAAEKTAVHQFIQNKGTRKLSGAELDSLASLDKKANDTMKVRGSLRGMKIAIDPGHFGITPSDAQIERKYLLFTRGAGRVADTIKLYESLLNYHTASVLMAMLQEKGAEVMMTRDAAGHTSFDCSYTEWLKNHRRRVLDSLVATGHMNAATKSRLLRADALRFYHEFFRDYELLNRAKRINRYKPDATVIIHYNVDEKNAPWKKESRKNYTMAFIPGAFMPADLQRKESLAHFLRWLLSADFEDSRTLAGLTVREFSEKLNIPLATASDAQYLRANCLPAGLPGVFCRNLVLCRTVNSPVVYGESLYQDNTTECKGLMSCDQDFYGVKTSERVGTVARCYFEALSKFFESR
jgi:N-acetylmuramoyl-L-alanine amidase